MAFDNEDIVYKGSWTVPSQWGFDGTRPLRYAIDDYGWVQLGGWIRYIGGSFLMDANASYGITSTLPAAILPVGYRDFLGVTSWGAEHYWILDGQMSFRTFQGVDLLQNTSWLSFDGCSYRL